MFIFIKKFIVPYDLTRKLVSFAQQSLVFGLVEYENLNKHVDDAQDIIVKIVKAVSQTYVDKLKEAGKFTNEAQDYAKKQAMSIATALISIEGKEAIEQLHGNFQNYLDTVI